MIDLHCHSSCSDGTYTPTQIVGYAAKKQISVLSLTDHDTIAGLDEAREEAKKVGITFVDGIEINSYYQRA